MTHKIIVSFAHQWVQALPLSDYMCICTDCKLKAPMAKLPTGGCTTKYEMATSGWTAR